VDATVNIHNPLTALYSVSGQLPK